MLTVRRLHLSLAAAARCFSSELPSHRDLLAPYEPPIAAAAAAAGGDRDTLGLRLLKLIYPKRKAVVVLRKWKEEGKTIQKYQLNRVVRELRKYNRYKHALEICEWMRTQEDIKLLPGDYAVHLDLVAKVRGLASAEKFFVDLPERMKGQSTCSALLHTYVQNKLSSKAEALMKEMSDHGLLTCSVPYNHMLSLYISKGELEKVPKLMEELKKNTIPCELTYNLWLNACAIQNDVEGAENVFLEMRKRKIAADWITYSTMANIYIRANLCEEAKEALKEMEKRVSRKERPGYFSLISLHASLSNRDEVDRLMNKMKSLFRKFSDTEYKCMISSLVRLGDIKEAKDMYKEWESMSGTRDSRVPNILLSFYAKNGMMEKAESFHKHTVQAGIKPSYVTWETLALGYLKKTKMDKVLDCLEKAFSSLEKWEPNGELTGAVLSELEKLGDTEGAERFLVMLRNAAYVTTEIYNSLLRTYARAGKMPLIINERMENDNVLPNEESQRLIKLTSRYCAGSVSTLIS